MSYGAAPPKGQDLNKPPKPKEWYNEVVKSPLPLTYKILPISTLFYHKMEEALENMEVSLNLKKIREKLEDTIIVRPFHFANYFQHHVAIAELLQKQP